MVIIVRLYIMVIIESTILVFTCASNSMLTWVENIRYHEFQQKVIHQKKSKFVNFLSKISLHQYFTVSAGFTIGLRPRDRSELMQGVFLSFFSNGLQVLDLSQLGC